MTENAAKPVHTSSRIPFGLAVAAVLAAAGVLGLVFGVQDIAAAMSSSNLRPEVTVDQGVQSAGNLLAGDHVRQTMHISAHMDVSYAMRVGTTGSTHLAGRLVARISNARTGETLYKGPLADAGFETRVLRAKGTEELLIDVHLPSPDATTSASSIGVAWKFSATELSGS